MCLSVCGRGSGKEKGGDALCLLLLLLLRLLLRLRRRRQQYIHIHIYIQVTKCKAKSRTRLDWGSPSLSPSWLLRQCRIASPSRAVSCEAQLLVPKFQSFKLPNFQDGEGGGEMDGWDGWMSFLPRSRPRPIYLSITYHDHDHEHDH